MCDIKLSFDFNYITFIFKLSLMEMLMKILKLVLLSASIITTFCASALDIQGTDKFGYNIDGFDNEKYNFFGYNKEGINRQGCHIYKYKNNKLLDCSIDLFAEKAKDKHRINMATILISKISIFDQIYKHLEMYCTKALVLF